MPPMQGQIGGFFKAVFVTQSWSLCREKTLVTGAISKEMHKPSVEQTISPKFPQVKSVGLYDQENICSIKQEFKGKKKNPSAITGHK